MNAHIRAWTGVAAAALVLAGCSSAADPAPTEGAGGGSSEPAPANPFQFTAATVDGGTLEGETLMGEDVILWFWAPWCPTCLVEGKDHVSGAIADLPEGVELVGIAGRSEDFAAMEEFLEWTGTGDARHVADVDGTIWESFGVALQPAFLFVNDDGTVQRGGAGLTSEDILAQAERLASS